MEKAYKDYANIMAEIKVLEAERDLVKGEIIEALREEPENKRQTKFGNFTLGSRQVWSYSEKIGVMQDKVKMAMDKEQKKGIAKATTTEYVVFTILKD